MVGYHYLMATVVTSDEKLEKLKMEILETFQELSNYLSVYEQKLLSRLIRIKEGYDKNTEIDVAIEQLRSRDRTGFPAKSRSRPKSAYFVPVPVQPGSS